VPTSVELMLDEAVWNKWIAKGRERDQRDIVVRIKAVKWFAITGLVAAAILWPLPAPFDVAVRFLVTASAMAAMWYAIRTRYFADSAVFGALALVYNPVVPAFSLPGDWQRALVAISAVPFAATLGWHNSKKVSPKHHD